MPEKQNKKAKFRKLLQVRKQLAVGMSIQALTALNEGLRKKLIEDYPSQSEDFVSGYQCCIKDIDDTIKALNEE